jgi:positive regulator of sigma E activity
MTLVALLSAEVVLPVITGALNLPDCVVVAPVIRIIVSEFLVRCLALQAAFLSMLVIVGIHVGIILGFVVAGRLSRIRLKQRQPCLRDD